MSSLNEYLVKTIDNITASMRPDSDIFNFNLAVILHEKSYAWSYDSIEICVSCMYLDKVMKELEDYKGIPYTQAGPWDCMDYLMHNKTIPIQEFIGELKLRRSHNFLSISFPTKSSYDGFRKTRFSWYELDDVRHAGNEYLDLDEQMSSHPENFLFYKNVSGHILTNALKILNKR